MPHVTSGFPSLTVSNSFDSSPEIASTRTRSLSDLYANSERIDALLATVGQPTTPSETLPGRVHPSDDEGLTVEDALRGPEAERWKTAMTIELEALRQNSTYLLYLMFNSGSPLECLGAFRTLGM